MPLPYFQPDQTHTSNCAGIKNTHTSHISQATDQFQPGFREEAVGVEEERGGIERLRQTAQQNMSVF
jgi:hypothetical protein